MTFVLAIDTCGSSGYVGIFDVDLGTVAAEESLPERGTQEALLPAIVNVLNVAGCSAGDLAAIAVVAGPGSFTGVRIGIAAVKGLAEALVCPVIALSRLAVLLAAVPPATGETTGATAWLDAGRGDVYTAQGSSADSFAAGLQGAVRGREEALRSLPHGGTVVVLEPVLLEAAPGAVLVTDEAYRQSLTHLSKKAFHSKHFADTALFDAEYLRVPDAELAMRARTSAMGQAV